MDGLIVACPACGTRNRKNPLKADQPVCAKCGAALPRGGGPIALDELQFLPVLRAAQVPVLVDFWASWCGPCRVFAPVFEQYARAHADDVLCVKVDTEANPSLAARFGIRSIPTLVAFRGGLEVARQAGAMPAAALDEWVRQTVRQAG